MTNCSNTKLQLVNSEEKIEGFDSIVHFLDRLKLFESNIKVSSEFGKEEIQAHIALVNPFTQELILRPSDSKILFPQFEGNKILIQNQAGNISFLTMKGTLSRPHYLNIKLPQFITLINLRSNSRIIFEDQNIKADLLNHKTRNFKMETQKFHSQLLDISPSGVAIKSINPALSELKKNDRLTITSLGSLSLKENITGTIAYVKNVASDVVASGVFQVGLQFSAEIDLETLIKKLNKK